MPEHDPIKFAAGLSAKLASGSRHVCAFLGAGVARACGLPDVGGLQTKVLADLAGDDQTIFARELEGRNLEQVLTRLRRIAALLSGEETLGGLTSERAHDLDATICKAIIKELDIGSANLTPVLRFAAWVRRANYRLPLELFTVNYDLLLETALEQLRVPYFDGFIGTLRARFQTELVEGAPGTDGDSVPAFFVRLWKLHGSVNWAWEDDKQVVRLGQPTPDGRAAAIHPSDTKYEESKRVPFVVLQDRLRRAMHQPETLVIISGYSFSDPHLNELIFDAASQRERSEFVAFCHSSIPEVLAERAIITPNLQIATGREAILGGIRGEWRARKSRHRTSGRTASWPFVTSGTWPLIWREVRRGNQMTARFRHFPTRRQPRVRELRRLRTVAERDPTCIGRVRHVLGATVTVALDPDLAGVAPIYRGSLQPVGQIGSLVRIPQGLVDLIATVNLVGIAELAGSLAPSAAVQRDDRWLQVQLLGEIDRGTGRFQRGVGSYPGLDDPVHFATPDQLKSVFPPPGIEHIKVGRLAAAEEVPVCLEATKFVVRHSAVVGSTGSGKTSAVASLLQRFVSGGWRAANIVVIDPHGEYASALEGIASVRSVIAQGDSGLRVPYWALPATDILRIFAGTPGSATFSNRFGQLVGEARRSFVDVADWLNLDPTAVTADTPVPFDIREVWHQLDLENRETRMNKGDANTACQIDPGDAATLRPAQFQPYGPAGQPPHQSPMYGMYGTGPELLRLGLVDAQLRFFQQPAGNPHGEDPLVEVIQEWLGKEKPLSVLDFSGVPASAADVAIGVVLNLLFEVSVRGDHNGPGVGRGNPILVVLEEAHRYLGEGATALTRNSANRIAREGRKYGMGLLLVTQRPTELPKTALAQCGTIIALRLSNSDDQGTIKAALPDTVAGLAAVLPSLRTHEAIISGEAVVLPTRACLDNPNPWPKAEDPTLIPWRQEPRMPDIGPALGEWRGTYETP